MTVPALNRNGLNLVTTERPLALPVAFGPQGPQGEAGPVGPMGEGSVTSIIAAEALGGGRIVTGTGNHSQPGTFGLVLGITVGAASVATLAQVRTAGIMTEPSWGWTPGGAVFASANGIMTQTAPTSGVLRQVAVAVATDTILVDIQPIIILG